MLRELKIENLAIIDELDIEFDKGFIVLTGETGAGKSIILSGINLLIGEKASVDMIRDGEENLVAQGVFDVDEEQKKALEAMGIDIDGEEIIIRRSYSRSGKARAFVNNVRISLTDLKEIASTLVDIVGQHSHQMLLNKNNHIKLLDSFLNKDEKDLKEKLSDIDSGDFKTKELKKELNKIKTEYDKIAEKISNSRKEIAIKIENELLNELKFLNMEDAKLKVQINKLEKMTNDGYDEVEFFISTNVGQDLKPLNKIASGGEVSRVMLALKVIFSKVDNIPILIFDEIDTGIGGETVRKIALKLKEIGENTQIISITHSPVIASKASQQFYIEKYVENSKTISRVKKLSAEERIKEIGRMLVGEKINNEVLEIANKMLNEG